MKIESFMYSSPRKGQSKQYAIIAMAKDSNRAMPIIYLQRPKWIEDDAVWLEIVKSIRLELPRGFEIK